MGSRLTYANVMATIGVFIAIGGTSYAAVQLGKNSVKARNIAPNAVRSPKVKNGSLLAKDFKAGQLPAGATGPAGPPGEPGEPGPPGPAVVRQSTNVETTEIDKATVTVVQLGDNPSPPAYSGNYSSTPIVAAGDYFGLLVQAHLHVTGTPTGANFCELQRFVDGSLKGAAARVDIANTASPSVYLNFSDFSFAPGTRFGYAVQCTTTGKISFDSADMAALGGPIVAKFPAP